MYRVAAGRGRGPGADEPPREPRRRRGYSGWLPVSLRAVTWVDIVVALGVLVLLYAVVEAGRGASVSFTPGQVGAIDTSPTQLPYYAARSLLRMFIALGLSFTFTFIYGYVAARYRRAEKVMIPALDILQSIPDPRLPLDHGHRVHRTVPGLVPRARVRGDLRHLHVAGLEPDVQLLSLAHDRAPRARRSGALLRLPRWTRFWRLDVPNAAIGLVWNGMMSMGGGWFFLVAAEAISVLNHSYTLPGHRRVRGRGDRRRRPRARSLSPSSPWRSWSSV